MGWNAKNKLGQEETEREGIGQEELGREGVWQEKVGQIPSQHNRFFVIATDHHYKHSDIQSEAGSSAAVQPPHNLMSLVFLDEGSSGMTHLLQFSVPRAALVVEALE